MRKLIFVSIVAIFGFGMMACNNDGSNATLEVRLTDAPGDYQAVNIDIQGVEVNAGNDEGGWKSLDIGKGVYNILEYTNGLDTLLGKIELPAGRVSQVRLILGNNNSIKLNDLVYSLNTPSAQQSGLKLKINADLQEGITYRLLLDFDAARSIVSTGSGRYNLKPVIRTIAEATSGAVRGTINPIDATPAVYAIVGTDTIGTAYADQITGKFLIQGLTPGTYKITFEPKEGYLPVVKESVAVTLGSVTDLGAVAIGQ